MLALTFADADDHALAVDVSDFQVLFLEAWHDVPMLGGLVFEVGFLVSVVWMILKGPSRVKPKSFQMASPTGLAPLCGVYGHVAA
jgi:hypothetical protein